MQIKKAAPFVKKVDRRNRLFVVLLFNSWSGKADLIGPDSAAVTEASGENHRAAPEKQLFEILMRALL